MKTLLAVAALVALGGCAVQQPYYTARPAVSDPYQWHTVSVQPSDRMSGGSGQTVYTTEPAPVVYSAPVVTYAPAPVYYAPAPAYYYPPVTIGLDFAFGNWCCGHRWGGRGHYRHR